jgi:hypothetical protein
MVKTRDMKTIDQQQNLERFGELVLADHELHDQLRAAVNQEAFVALAVQLGAERGCELTAPVVQAGISEMRRAWLERWL